MNNFHLDFILKVKKKKKNSFFIQEKYGILSFTHSLTITYLQILYLKGVQLLIEWDISPTDNINQILYLYKTFL